MGTSKTAYRLLLIQTFKTVKQLYFPVLFYRYISPGEQILIYFKDNFDTKVQNGLKPYCLAKPLFLAVHPIFGRKNIW